MLESLSNQFRTIRGRRIILDIDLARFYGVTTRHLNIQISRNRKRFPEDFAFRLSSEEAASVIAATAAPLPGHSKSRRPPRAFTAIGALVASSVLNTPKAIEISLQLVREFVAAAHDPAFGRDVHSELTDTEWRLSGKPGSPFDILRIFGQGR